MSLSLSQIPMNAVLLHHACTRQWLLYAHPVEVVQAFSVGEVMSCLRHVEGEVESRGRHAAGFVSYDASPAFDPAFVVRPTDTPRLPMLWFGIYETPHAFALPETGSPVVGDGPWSPSMTPGQYETAFDCIKAAIRAGDAYQVNLTYRLRRRFSDASLWPAFLAMIAAQQSDYGACIRTRDWSVSCASPECFFHLDGTRLVSRPMKGTAPRGLTSEADQRQAAELCASEKNAAENLMIVDMVRNDMGRIARPGSVAVPDLLALEKYPTVWQLTSRVVAETTAPVADIFGALFPPASITGAPKARATRIIADVETTPRGLYTGAIGSMAPGRQTQFNVAIRTLVADRGAQEAEYGVGGGIVWDSDCQDEQAECRAKSAVLRAERPPFSLLETMRWTPASGYVLLDRHLRRLRDSADYFDYAVDVDGLASRLAGMALSFGGGPQRVRVLAACDGAIELQAVPLPEPSTAPPPLRIGLAREPVDRGDVFLYHKTTHRQVYATAMASVSGVDDVVLWNADGEVTETTRFNILAEIDGVLCTPPVSCGLLAGTWRARMLDAGEVVERVIPVGALPGSPRIRLVNSVRGEVAAAWTRSQGAPAARR